MSEIDDVNMRDDGEVCFFVDFGALTCGVPRVVRPFFFS